MVWGNTTIANQSRLVKLQKRAARLILKADILTPSDQTFKELLVVLPETGAIQHLSYGLQKHEWIIFPNMYHQCSL